MNILNHEAPLKILIKDLNQFKKSDNLWLYNFNEEANISITLNKVHIQGEINKTAGFLKEILIINDGTAKAKVTRGSQVPGDLSWINVGMYCSIIGNVIDNGKLPHINAIKIARISNAVLKEMWPYEVSELRSVILGNASPNILQDYNEASNTCLIDDR